MAIVHDDSHFRQFASSLELAIKQFGETDDVDFLARQKRQVDTLIDLEKQFKRALISHVHGETTYKKFVSFICDERRNILDARPFFRERQGRFTQEISKALRRQSARGLYRFNFNFRFVHFVLGTRAWSKSSKLVRLARDIDSIRGELITMNMPLAISRARIFYSRTPKAHLTYMDFIQIACEGLMSGIDKFVPPFSKAFRSVAIGRMTGNFIEQYSETPIHFYPREKRKIYRANKLLGRTSGTASFEELTVHVNDGVEAAHKTNPDEIASLLAAASTVSADTPATDDDGGESIPMSDRFAAPHDSQPDVICEQQDSMRQLSAALRGLSYFERKLLLLKGVNLI